jgi:acyl-CoA reductase-like NAD-dependent aldehyde dehydrogenase
MTATATRDLDVGALLPGERHHIGGEWVAGRGGETIDVINPATQDVLLRVPRGGPEDVDAAVQAAAAAFPAWRDTNPMVRADLLYRWAELISEHQHELDLIERMEVGRPHWGPSRLPRMIIYLAGMVDKIHGKTLPTARPGLLGMTLREPYGVVGSIVPWNSPAHLMAHDVAPAIGAGNTIVVKPAEDAPLACLFLAKLAAEAGIPPGVVNVVTGYGGEAGAALPAHPLVRRMSFTGSPETGTKIMEACARHHIPLHLELGGKSPQIVLRDADLAKAVPAIVRSITLNTGQVCAAGSRLLAPPELRDELIGAISDAFTKVRIGPWYEDVQMGPLISAKQERRVLGYLDIGREEGAEIVTGGHKLSGDLFDKGFFVEPTLFDRVRPDMRIAQEEIFGPVLSVIDYTDEEEALAIANGTKYGLTASVWTSDIGRAVRIAKNVQAGHVYVNTPGAFGVIGAPWGGTKGSGFGRTMSPDIVEEYTQVKTVVIDGDA